jgi:hypothetical protein
MGGLGADVSGFNWAVVRLVTIGRLTMGEVEAEALTYSSCQIKIISKTTVTISFNVS